MPRALVVIFAWILLLVGLLAGGCSLILTGLALDPYLGHGGGFGIWIAVWLVIAVLCLWVGVRLLRRPRQPAPEPGPQEPPPNP